MRLGALALLFVACGAPRVGPDTHGVSVESGPCGRGLVVVESDYQSSNVSLFGFDGALLSSSIASSSTESSGFGVALSGDVVPASTPQLGDELVLVDRYPAGVLRFVELASARVRAELSVATGFRANPQDYLALGPERAYVSRYERNPNSGREAFDGGGDVLIVDPSAPKILGRIELAAALDGEAKQYSPHPARMLEVDGRVFVLLAAYADDYRSALDSRLVELDPNDDSLASTLVLEGLRGCAGLASSPDHRELAVSCTGDDLASVSPSLANSGIGLIDISSVPRLKRRFPAADVGERAIGFSVGYAADDRIFLGALGQNDDNGAPVLDDALLQLDTRSGETRELRRSRGEPFTLSGAQCAVACSACFATDAARAGGSLLRFPIEGSGALGEPTSIRSESNIGLPPRYLGAF